MKLKKEFFNTFCHVWSYHTCTKDFTMPKQKIYFQSNFPFSQILQDTKANPDVSTALSINLTLANGSVATK